MARTKQALAIVAVALAATSLPAAAPPVDLEGISARVDDLAGSGLQEAAPSEIEIAGSLLEAARSGKEGAAELASAQLDLLEALDETRRLEAAAIEAEQLAIEAEMDSRTEKAAYEFVVEQILASGVASFWSVP